jgi:Family of unknown function (DUF6266)
MGTIEKGYLGGFKGILGTAVGSKWKGKSVVKSRPPRKRTTPSTELQLQQQAKFALIIAFLKPIRTLLNQTYKKPAAGDMSGHNMAFSVNKDAITGVYPAFAIDYPKVLLSQGGLDNVDAPAAASNAAGKLVFTWTDNSDGVNELISDMAFVAAYSEEKKRWIQKQQVATRSAGTCTLDVPAFSGKPVQTYIGFMSADRKKISDSLYTGVVNIL